MPYATRRQKAFRARSRAAKRLARKPRMTPNKKLRHRIMYLEGVIRGHETIGLLISTKHDSYEAYVLVTDSNGAAWVIDMAGATAKKVQMHP